MKKIRSVLLLTGRGVKKTLSASSNKQREFRDWWDSKPKPITLFPGEKEIFREGPVLVTDTRISHIDPYDRILKTYMFEHMISLNKDFYHASVRTRRICISLIVLASLTLLFTVVIDVMDESLRRFMPVYIPLLVSLLVGLIVWRDMRPKYRIEWSMRDGKSGGIQTEPLFREWLVNNNGREQFMNKLVEAMNQAIAGKAWWPHREALGDAGETNSSESRDRHTGHAESDALTGIDTPPSDSLHNSKTELKLVTNNYQ